jgi:hypothetical protein
VEGTKQVKKVRTGRPRRLPNAKPRALLTMRTRPAIHKSYNTIAIRFVGGKRNSRGRHQNFESSAS